LCAFSGQVRTDSSLSFSFCIVFLNYRASNQRAPNEGCSHRLFLAECGCMGKFDYRTGETASGEGAKSRIADWFAHQPQMPYVVPFFAYLLVMVPSTFGHWGGIDWKTQWKEYLPAVYSTKTVIAAILLWVCWPWYTRVRWTRLGLGAIVGLIGTLVWIASEYACQHLGIAHRPDSSDIYDPTFMIPNSWARWAFLSIRVAGPTLVVPVMEELFFRDFLMRALIMGVRFDAVPVGTFSWFSLLGMSALFGINHGWNFFVPGVLYGLMMGVLLIRTKSLGACMVAHGVTNWTLYLYVIYARDWQFM
jgi:uncharacterized protein